MHTLSLFCRLLTVSLLSLAKADGAKRIFVTALWRHGDRSAIKDFPLDPNNRVNTWPQGHGQLSTIGMQQHLELGKLLRKRFQGFLSPVFKEDEVYVRSTDVNRTLMSALSNMAAMFPGTPGNMSVLNGIPSDPAWPKHWLPVPVHTLPGHLDVCNMGCDAADDYYESVTAKLPAFQANATKYQWFFDYLQNVTGYPHNRTASFDDMYWTYDTILCERYHRDVHRLPTWSLNATVWNMTRDLASANNAFAYTGARRMLKGGPIIQDIALRMERKLACAQNSSAAFCSEVNNLKYYVYSAHDSTVMKVMAAMKTTFPYMPRATPDYAGCILWELWQEADGSHTVRTFYKNGIFSPDFVNMTIPGCPSHICPLDTFMKVLAPMFPSDIHAQCASKQYRQDKVKRAVGAASEAPDVVHRRAEEEREEEGVKERRKRSADLPSEDTAGDFATGSDVWSTDLLSSAGVSPQSSCAKSTSLKNSVIGLSVSSALLLAILCAMLWQLHKKGGKIDILPC